MAIALVFLFANLIGLGLGPVITGFISDTLAPAYGSGDALRYALVAMTSLLLLCAAALWRTGALLTRDAEA